MNIEFFSFLNYRKLKQRSWKECGLNYDLEMVQYSINHPEWFDYNNPPLRLVFPPKPEEVGVFPYSLEEIKYMEEQLDYEFPKAFKEVLFLFGGLYLDPLQGGGYRVKYDSINGWQKIDIEKDIANLKKNQLIFKESYFKMQPIRKRFTTLKKFPKSFLLKHHCVPIKKLIT